MAVLVDICRLELCQSVLNMISNQILESLLCYCAFILALERNILNSKIEVEFFNINNMCVSVYRENIFSLKF